MKRNVKNSLLNRPITYVDWNLKEQTKWKKDYEKLWKAFDSSEKDEDKLMIELHHHMKELNGYEKLEIASKRKSLEDVLIPEKIDSHLNRLHDVGFKKSLIWLKCFNFVSIVAFK